MANDETLGSDALDEILRFEGAGADRAGFRARLPVSAVEIRQMADAAGDRNPIHTDEAFACASAHGGIVAPPLWLYTWMMPGLEPERDDGVLPGGDRLFHLAPGGQRRPDPRSATLRDELNAVLSSHGFTSPAVTNMAFRYLRYLRPGETPRFSSWIVDSIVGPKTTKLGPGFFVDMHIDMFVGDEPVATIAQRYLRSRPAAPSEPKADRSGAARAVAPPASASFAPARSATESLGFTDIAVGAALPGLVVSVSPTLIVDGAVASRDFQDVHHDYRVMAARGHPDIFMNNMTTSGLIGRFLTDWTGPDARITAHELKLGRPNYAGDTMRLGGQVRSATIVDGRRTVIVDVTADNSLGRHAAASVTFELP